MYCGRNVAAIPANGNTAMRQKCVINTATTSQQDGSRREQCASHAPVVRADRQQDGSHAPVVRADQQGARGRGRRVSHDCGLLDKCCVHYRDRQTHAQHTHGQPQRLRQTRSFRVHTHRHSERWVMRDEPELRRCSSYTAHTSNSQISAKQLRAQSFMCVPDCAPGIAHVLAAAADAEAPPTNMPSTAACRNPHARQCIRSRTRIHMTRSNHQRPCNLVCVNGILSTIQEVILL